VDQSLPVFEIEVAGQGLQIVEEGLARRQLGPHAAVGLVAQVENGVKQEGQQVEHDQYHRQVLVAVAEVVLQVVAVVLEHIVVLIFDLPARAGRHDKGA